MTDTHDYLALDWVKGEIQETLNQSQQALEAFVENPDDSTRMRFCQTYLHQVYGTLQMVEFYGAALLAEEMEKLAQALLEGKVAQVADAHETLMRAILQLPPYLDRVQASRRDLPVVLLPLLNDLRASRGESLLSETSLFKPDLASGAGKGDVPLPVAADPNFPALARKIRQMYQIALLGVIRGEKLDESYGYMRRVFQKLDQVTGEAPMAPVWEIGLALIEALSAGALQPGTSVKSVLGHIDRLMRELSAQGAAVLSKTPPAELLKNLLYFIAKCEAETPRILRLKEIYRLADALPSESLINEERARMSGPDQAAMASVVQALSEELNKVKDALEQFIHNESADAESLKAQAIALKQIGDTVAVLGLGQPRNVINEQVAAVESMASGDTAVSRDALMNVAGALLHVEATLQGVARDRRSSPREGSVLAAAPDHVNAARDAVIRECRAGLEEGKDGIVEFIASQWDQSHLVAVPGKLNAVRGGLEVIGLLRPAKILRQCVLYIETELLGEDVARPEWRSMDTLADAITSVEYYLERLSDDPETTDDILDVARNSVAQLGYQIDDADFGRGESDSRNGAVGVAGLASEEIDLALPEVAADKLVESEIAEPVKSVIKRTQPAQDEGEELPEISDDDLVEFEQSEVERMRLEAEAEAAKNNITAATEEVVSDAEPDAIAAAPTESAKQTDSGDDADYDLIDDEIIEIFVEEASEVLEALDEYFPRWVANQADEEALIEFRRAFHTLKGSGRMVGAMSVGELAWSIENMLNRVIDNTVVATPILIELVKEVHRRIPALVEAFSTRSPDPFDVEPLKQAAFALTEGGEIESVPDVSVAAAEPDQIESAQAPSAETIDLPTEPSTGEDDSGVWVLRDIFSAEATANLQLLRDWLESIDTDLSTAPVSDDALRALHTLKGSARMAEIEGVAALAEPAERYAKAIINAASGANAEAIALFTAAADMLAIGVADMVEDVNTIDGAAALIGELDAATQALLNDQGRALGDQHLIAVFLSEGLDLVMDADSLIARWAAQPGDTGEIEKLRDELVMLGTGATTAGVVEVAELACALAECHGAIVEQRLWYSADFFALAIRAHEMLIALIDYLAAGQALVRDEAVLAELAKYASSTGPDDDPNGGESEDAISYELPASVDVVEDVSFDDVDAPDKDAGTSSEHLNSLLVSIDEGEAELVEEAPEIAATSTSATVNASEEGELEHLGDIDAELADIFLEEAEEVLESASTALDTWENGDASLVPGLQRDLHTLKGGARMAGIAAIGDLAHELETLYEGYNAGQFEADAALFHLLHQCHDRLIEMVEMMRAQSACRSAPALVGKIVAFLQGRGIEASELSSMDMHADEPGAALGEIEVAEAESEAEPVLENISNEVIEEPPSEPAPEMNVAVEDVVAPAPPPERDEELVGIFLEEADEILESAGTSLESWMEAPDNLIEVQSLQRDLHTLKGGARMSEIPELGDLGHELENLYEGLAMGNLKPTQVLFQLLQACHDRLAVMVEGVKANQGLHPANDFIAAIHGYIADPSGFVLPPLHGVAPVAAASVASVDVAPVPTSSPTVDGPVVLPADVDADILGIFIEEAAELRGSLKEQLDSWLAEPIVATGELIKRSLHTLKGGARLAGLTKLGDVSHEFEQLMERIDLRQAPYEVVVNQMRSWQQQIDEQVELLQKALAAQPAAPAPAVVKAAPAKSEQQSGSQTKQDAQQAAKRNIASQQPQEMVRIGADVLESLVNLAGETSINRGRVEQGITEFAGNVTEMGNTIERLYEQLRRLDVETESQIMSNYQQGLEAGQYDEDFDPLEMDQYSGLHQITKQLSESASDLLDLKNTLIDRSRDTETLLLQQSRINTELQEKLMRTRMVPFTRLVPRLRRIVRQVSGEINKNIEFDVINPDGELDRTLMERVVAPLEHMLRNAVDHGVEDAAGRVAAGKDPVGHVSLELSREGGEVVLILSDDGKGIDTVAVRAKAVERGLIDADADLSDQEIQQFIFNAGFSTAAKVTQISGRGVGMDVVASEIKQMGGSVTIESKKGTGTRFFIRLPFTLAMNRALMIRVGEDQYAIPLNQIDGIVRISPYELESFYGDEAKPFTYARQQYELTYMGDFVHGQRVPSHLMHSQTPLPVLLIRSADHQVAVLVDGLIGSREVVVKSVGPQLSTVAGISGATILGDGSVVIILDVHSLIRAAHMQRQHRLERHRAAELSDQPLVPEMEEPALEEVRSAPLIMVTDDSVTVRKVTTRFLERNGYEVMTAKDGIDALAKLDEHKPDLMLLDIEMPRMDGFEVATHVRHEERLKDVPIIMITSRTGEKHRERAFDIGVNSYLGKPFQEAELLSTIQELLSSVREKVDS
jgi:chemosensory pili system protein ChpA (sensor histidine kinase/response regulator)